MVFSISCKWPSGKSLGLRGLLFLWSQVRVLWLLIWWPLEVYMVVNFRARGISRGALKLARTPTLIKKKKKKLNKMCHIENLSTMTNVISPHLRHMHMTLQIYNFKWWYTYYTVFSTIVFKFCLYKCVIPLFWLVTIDTTTQIAKYPIKRLCMPIYFLICSTNKI